MDCHSLTPYYFPTTVVFIDDDAAYLDSLSLSMPEDMALRTYANPRAALDHIEEVTHMVPVPERCFVVPETADSDGSAPMLLDLTPITDTLYSEQRYAEVAVVVIDYDMPAMDGLAVCRALAGKPVKKLLLTGKADQSVAIDAFNQGLIDQYMCKSSDDILPALEGRIKDLQQAYFREVSQPIMPALGEQARRFLSDPEFNAHFRTLAEQHHWVEYYLDPLAPGLLCLDVKGKASLLMVTNREELPQRARLAQQRSASSELVGLIRSGEVMCNPRASGDDWRAAVVLAHPVPDSDWLVAVVENPSHLAVSSERLLTYSYYLEILEYMSQRAGE